MLNFIQNFGQLWHLAIKYPNVTLLIAFLFSLPIMKVFLDRLNNADSHALDAWSFIDEDGKNVNIFGYLFLFQYMKYSDTLLKVLGILLSIIYCFCFLWFLYFAEGPGAEYPIFGFY